MRMMWQNVSTNFSPLPTSRLYQLLASKCFYFIKINLTSHYYCIVFICASQFSYCAPLCNFDFPPV
jgi:hypothetical protein